ncbi:MAG: zinc-ribbon domain-containing protein [Clostridiales bacterium]|nr:zinc-ribbon domain-containing protein [Clostridiales bacterium]
MPDKKLICKDCGKEFIFTEGEQKFYAEKGFTNEPIRCKECRAAKKARFNNDRTRHESFNSPRITRL